MSLHELAKEAERRRVQLQQLTLKSDVSKLYIVDYMKERLYDDNDPLRSIVNRTGDNNNGKIMNYFAHVTDAYNEANKEYGECFRAMCKITSSGNRTQKDYLEAVLKNWKSLVSLKHVSLSKLLKSIAAIKSNGSKNIWINFPNNMQYIKEILQQPYTQSQATRRKVEQNMKDLKNKLSDGNQENNKENKKDNSDGDEE